MKTVRYGGVSVTTNKGYTVTRFPDGKTVCALHAEQPGQADTAARIGCSVEVMNRSHDRLHSALAFMLGLECSPALRAVADGAPHSPLHDIEEEAVLAVQRFACAVGKL